MEFLVRLAFVSVGGEGDVRGVRRVGWGGGGGDWRCVRDGSVLKFFLLASY